MSQMMLLTATSTLERLNTYIVAREYDFALKQLTLLSHQNLHLLKQLIQQLANDPQIKELCFRLQIKLYLSEQSLNEQKIEDAEKQLTQIIKQAGECECTEVLILGYLQLAVLKSYQQKETEALAIFAQCDQLSTTLKSVEIDIQIAIYRYHFYSESDAGKAGKQLYHALQLSQETKLDYWQAYCLLHLGTLNTVLGNHSVALNFFKEAHTLFEQLGCNLSMADNLMCQFNIYYRQKEFEQAIQCLKQAIALATDCGWEHKIALCYGNLSTVYLQLEKYDEAANASEKDIQISTKLKNKQNVGVAYFRLGRIEAAKGNTSKAIELLKDSIEIRKNQISNTQLSQVYFHLHRQYEIISDFENAYKTQSLYLEQKFKILDAEKAKENEALREKYESEKRETELKEARILQTESELKALKAQMNPHFIFNALNSIQEIFFLGDKRLANKHLSNFSQLTRKILHASTKSSITLQEEIETLEQYLSLEALRFSDNFEYDLRIDENIDPYLIDLPPMLLQPFVENAIKHGLMHKTENRKLAIAMSLKEETDETAILKVSIKDNGVGRAASTVINAQKARIGQSFASEATEKRLSLLNLSSDESVSYIDLEEAGMPAGTEVQISIPIKF